MGKFIEKIEIFDWNEGRSKAAIALSEGKTRSEAAKEAGVSETTIYNWLNYPEFAAEVDRLSLMVGVALRAERMRIVHRVIRQLIKDQGDIPTEKDILDWLKYAQSETNGIKLDLAALSAAVSENDTSLAHSRSGRSTKANTPDKAKEV